MSKFILLFAFAMISISLNAQKKQQTSSNKSTSKNWGFFEADADYLFSINSKNTKPAKPLFASNGYNAGIAYRYGDKFGVKVKASFTGGKTNEKDLENFAQSLMSNGNTYKILGSKINWSQLNVAIGPSLMFAKYKGEINLLGGIGIGKANTLTIDKYDALTKIGTVYSATQKSVRPYWEIRARYNVLKIKKAFFLSLKASYGANGSTIGVGLLLMIAEDWIAIEGVHAEGTLQQVIAAQQSQKQKEINKKTKCYAQARKYIQYLPKFSEN